MKYKAVDVWKKTKGIDRPTFYVPKKNLSVKIAYLPNAAPWLIFRGLKVSVRDFKAMVDSRTCQEKPCPDKRYDIQQQVRNVQRFNLFPKFASVVLPAKDYDTDLDGLEPIMEPIVTSFGVLNLS